MDAQVFLNGEYLAEQDAKISPMDRGFLFGDGIYEVIPVYQGKVFCLQQHLQRLQKSCDGIRLNNPYSDKQWQQYIETLLQHNQHHGLDQSLYLQVTRGAPTTRDHLFPENVRPTVFMFSKPFPKVEPRWLEQGLKLVSADETRWQKCHLKTTSLVANVLHKQMAYDAGADEVILVRDGSVQECSVSNFFIVSEGIVKTPPISHYLLPGITRHFILQLMQANNIAYKEEPLSLGDVRQADEVWVCSSTKEVLPATELDGQAIGQGQPGQYWQGIYDLFQQGKV